MFKTKPKQQGQDDDVASVTDMLSAAKASQIASTMQKQQEQKQRTALPARRHIANNYPTSEDGESVASGYPTKALSPRNAIRSKSFFLKSTDVNKNNDNGNSCTFDGGSGSASAEGGFGVRGGQRDSENNSEAAYAADSANNSRTGTSIFNNNMSQRGGGGERVPTAFANQPTGSLANAYQRVQGGRNQDGSSFGERPAFESPNQYNNNNNNSYNNMNNNRRNNDDNNEAKESLSGDVSEEEDEEGHVGMMMRNQIINNNAMHVARGEPRSATVSISNGSQGKWQQQLMKQQNPPPRSLGGNSNAATSDAQSQQAMFNTRTQRFAENKNGLQRQQHSMSHHHLNNQPHLQTQQPFRPSASFSMGSPTNKGGKRGGGVSGKNAVLDRNASFASSSSLADETAKNMLEASSVGTNVRVTWRGIELARMHFAAIFLRWSVVSVLAEAAKANQRSGGYMVVDLSTLIKTNTANKPLFEEDFPNVFGSIFKESFVPSVHEKFNSQGMSLHSLPPDIESSYKLLVLCERLNAILQDDVMDHLQFLLTQNPAGSVGDNELVRVNEEGEEEEEAVVGENEERSVASFKLSDSPSFLLLRTTLDMIVRPMEGSREEAIIHQAIDILVEDLPERMPCLEELVRVSVEKQNIYMALLLFQETTQKTMGMGQEAAKTQTEETIEYIQELKKSFEDTRDTNHVDIFANLLQHNPVTMKEVRRVTDSTDMAFQQGIVLEKEGQGNHGGRRIVRLNGDYLEWNKLNAQVWQPQREILKSNITGIYMASHIHPAAFRIESNTKPVEFKAASVDSCRMIVRALQAWSSTKNAVYPGLRRGSAPAGPARAGPMSSGFGLDDVANSAGAEGGNRDAWMPPREANGSVSSHSLSGMMMSGQALANGGGNDSSANHHLSWNRQQDLKRISEKKEQGQFGQGQPQRKPISRLRAAAKAINLAASAGLARSTSGYSKDKMTNNSMQQVSHGYGPSATTRSDSWNPNNIQRRSVPQYGSGDQHGSDVM